MILCLGWNLFHGSKSLCFSFFHDNIFSSLVLQWKTYPKWALYRNISLLLAHHILGTPTQYAERLDDCDALFITDHRRYAAFCLWKIGTEIYDTTLLKDVDRSMTDLTFDDVVVL